MENRIVLGDIMGWLKSNHLEGYRKKGVKIGTGCKLCKHATLDTHGNLEIGNNVTVSGRAVLLTHDASEELTGKKNSYNTKIGNNVFIGINSIVLTGVTIGDNSIVGAGSVVTKDIPPNEIWAGNPAKKIRSY